MRARAAPPTTAPSSGLTPVAAPRTAPEPAPIAPPVTARWPHVSPQAVAPSRIVARVTYLATVDMTRSPQWMVREVSGLRWRPSLEGGRGPVTPVVGGCHG